MTALHQPEDLLHGVRGGSYQMMMMKRKVRQGIPYRPGSLVDEQPSTLSHGSDVRRCPCGG